MAGGGSAGRRRRPLAATGGHLRANPKADITQSIIAWPCPRTRSGCAAWNSLSIASEARKSDPLAIWSVATLQSDENSYVATSVLPALLTSLARHGWARHVTGYGDADAVINEVCRLGALLGKRAVGRAGALEEVVRPQSFEDAHPRSLSAHYGLHAFPFHVELSHRPRLCRYVLLGCIDPGSCGAVTKLLDWRALRFLSEEFDLLEEAPILVRTGRRSFYSTFLPPDRTFLRFDPGCLEAVDERGRSAFSLLEQRLALGSPEVHEWERGDILIIDNWRTLHGRGPSDVGSGRRLARILIDA